MNVATKPSAQAGTETWASRQLGRAISGTREEVHGVCLDLRASSIEEPILDLVNIRASQLNGCTFCLDMHVKQAKMHGERELRLYHLAAWRDFDPVRPARARRTRMDGSPDQAAGAGRFGRDL